MISRYSIETPPYARGRLVEDENGKILKLDEAAEIDSAMLAIRDVIEAKEPVDHVY